MLYQIECSIFVRTRPLPEVGRTAVVNRAAFKDRRFTLRRTGIFLGESALFLPLAYPSSYAEAHGISQPETVYLLSVLNAGSRFGRWFRGL